MIGFLSKMFGGNKSDKDVKRIQPIVAEVNRHFEQLQNLTHDQLRNKTVEFREGNTDTYFKKGYHHKTFQYYGIPRNVDAPIYNQL